MSNILRNKINNWKLTKRRINKNTKHRNIIHGTTYSDLHKHLFKMLLLYKIVNKIDNPTNREIQIVIKKLTIDIPPKYILKTKSTKSTLSHSYSITFPNSSSSFSISDE